MLTRRRFLRNSLVLVAGLWALGLFGRVARVGEALLAVPEPVSVPRPPGLRARLALLADPHIDDAHSIQKLKTALADLKNLAPDRYIFNGDLTNWASPREYELFKQLTEGLAVDATMGNHEFYDFNATDAALVGRFCQAFGYEKPYHAREIAGVQLLFLSGELRRGAPRNPEWAWLSDEQLRWLAERLSDRKPTIIFLHQPLNDTVAWSWGDNDFAGVGQAAELRALLARSPQVKLWFSGHTHQPVPGENQVIRQQGVTFVALSSSYYTFGEQAQKSFGPNVGRLLDLYEDRLVVRSRDFTTATWLEAEELTIDLTEAVSRGGGGPTHCRPPAAFAFN